jgi:OFA family oxalate/formate antiporter-like MFS transporter
MYGGGFASIPAYIGDLFGTKQLGAIHGYILTAWAAAGLAGPMFAAWMKDTTGSYATSLTFFAGLFVIALVVSLLIRRDINKLRAQNEAKNSGNSLAG